MSFIGSTVGEQATGIDSDGEGDGDTMCQILSIQSPKRETEWEAEEDVVVEEEKEEEGETILSNLKLEAVFSAVPNSLALS